MGFILPHPPAVRTGMKVAVVGSGPSGLACADLLNKWGHTLPCLKKMMPSGDCLRYGIPDFKLNKKVIDRRLEILMEEGIEFNTSTSVGKDVTGADLLKQFDAVCLTIGAMKPRALQP